MNVNWRKSSYSCANGCVEVGWRKSTYSGANGCVEVGQEDGRVLVRDSKLKDESQVIAFKPATWETEVLTAVLLDRDPMCVYRDTPGVVAMVWTALDKTQDELARLEFTHDEWDAFTRGVKAGQFHLEVLSRD